MVKKPFFKKVTLGLIFAFLSFQISLFSEGVAIIIGNSANKDFARKTGVQGSYVELVEDIPTNSNVVILGNPNEGIDSVQGQMLIDLGCKVIRICGKDRMETQEMMKAYKKFVEAGNEPFADVIRTIGNVKNEILFPVLEKAVLNNPKKIHKHPECISRTLFAPPAPPESEERKIPPGFEKFDSSGRMALNIRFDPMSDSIKSSSYGVLQKLLEYLKARPLVIAWDSGASYDLGYQTRKSEANRF